MERRASRQLTRRRGVIEHYGLEQAATPVSERPGWRKPKRILVGSFIPGIAEALQSAAPGVEFIVANPADIAKQAAGRRRGDRLLHARRRCRRQIDPLDPDGHCRRRKLRRDPGVRERDILVTNMQRIGGPIIAEHVMGMVLAFTRGIDMYVSAQPRAEWRRSTPPGRMAVVDGKTMLVVGLGGIGSEVAKRAHALGMKVIATRASGRTGPEFVSYVGLPDELPKLASEADFVVNTAPLTPQTTGIFDAAFFAKMKPTAYFINVARGRSVVTAALVEALNSKKIAGAGLDVTDPEPLPPDHPLWKAPNVIITPHVANDSDLGYEAQIKVVQENLRRYVAGERMLSVVDVQKGY